MCQTLRDGKIKGVQFHFESQCSQILITANGGDCDLWHSLSISFLIKRLFSVKGSAGFIEGSVSTIIHHLASHTPEYFLEPLCDRLTPIPALLGQSTCFVYREWALIILYIFLYSYGGVCVCVCTCSCTSVCT